VKFGRHIKRDSTAPSGPIGYSASVFPTSFFVRACAAIGIVASSACVGTVPQGKPESPAAAQVFFALTGEMALSRHEARLAALQYTAAAQANRDEALLRRATDVTAECLQPSLTAGVAARWLSVDPAAVDAHRAAARAALELHKIEQSATQYREVLQSSPHGADAEFAVLESEFASSDNVYGARQVADILAADFPASLPALRMQAFAAMRADDPAAAVRTFQAAMAAPAPEEKPAAGAAPPAAEANRRELTQGLWRARILAGDMDEPLAQAKALVEGDETADNRLDYVFLLVAAQQNSAARSQLALLVDDAKARPLALRLLGLVDFQEDKLADASAHFAELTTTGKFLDDAYYYLGLIAERHSDMARALRLYLQVQSGDNALSALLHAASILRSNGAESAAEDLLDQLVGEEPQRAPEILVARARIYSDAGDLSRALALLEKSRQEYPDSVQISYALASTAEERGDVSTALRLLKEVAAQRPSDPAALNAYGYTLADHDQKLGAARQLIERAYAAAPKNAAILDSMGWVLFRQRHGDQALPYLTEAYADDHDGDIAAHLGEVLWTLGRREDAERIWAEASRADSQNHLLKATQQRLHASK